MHFLSCLAKGFGGDRNWNKGFEFSLDQKVGKPVDLIGRSETARKVLSAMTAETVSPSEIRSKFHQWGGADSIDVLIMRLNRDTFLVTAPSSCSIPSGEEMDAALFSRPAWDLISDVLLSREPA